MGVDEKGFNRERHFPRRTSSGRSWGKKQIRRGLQNSRGDIVSRVLVSKKLGERVFRKAFREENQNGKI